MGTQLKPQAIDTTQTFVLSASQFSNGSAASPSITFSSDTDTGIYTAASNRINFAIGGVSSMSLDANFLDVVPRITGPLGSASAPAYSFSSDSDTGFYGLGDNSIRFGIGGTQRHIFDSSSFTIVNDAAELHLTRSSNSRTPILGIYDAFGGFRFHTPNSNAESTTVAYQWECDNPTTNTILAKTIANGQFQFQDGSVSIPAVSFLSDTDTGIYRSGANTVVVAAAGSNALVVSDIEVTCGSGRLLQIQDGTAAAPGIRFNNDQNLGLYRIGTDEMGVSAAGGNLLMRFGFAGGLQTLFRGGTSASLPGLALGEASGVGFYRISGLDIMGISAPMAFQAGTAANPVITFAGDENTGFYTAGTADTIRATVGGTQRMRIDTTGTYASGQLFVSDGTAGVPGFSFDLDTDTGIYRNGTNSMVVTAGGSGVMVFNNTPQLLSSGNGTAGNPIYSFGNRSDTGMYYLASVAGEVGFSTGGAVGYRMHPNVHAWYIGGVEKINIDSSGRFVPITDNSLSFGTSGNRWTTIFATNGTINTSHSSTKSNIVEIDPQTVEIPKGVFYDRDGRRYVGYLNDTLPVEARPIEDGKVVETMNYEHSVIGILCAVVKELREEVSALKAKIGE